jgi:hypothetical protein
MTQRRDVPAPTNHEAAAELIAPQSSGTLPQIVLATAEEARAARFTGLRAYIWRGVYGQPVPPAIEYEIYIDGRRFNGPCYSDLNDALAMFARVVPLPAEVHHSPKTETFARATTHSKPLSSTHQRRAFAACKNAGLDANNPPAMRDAINAFFSDIYANWQPIKSRSELEESEWATLADAIEGGTFTKTWQYKRATKVRAA